MPTTPNPPAEELTLGTYTTNAAATPYDTAFFDELLASESDPGLPDLPISYDWNTWAVPDGFGEPAWADPFVQGALDETLCPAAAMADYLTFEDILSS